MKKGMLCALFFLFVLFFCLPSHADSFDDDGFLRLVNRDHKITKKYVPELVTPNVPTNHKYQQEKIGMRAEAAEALERMFQAAMEEQGYQLLAVSGYRSFGEQQLMFENKVAAVGSKEKAWRTVAPAGASEHQLGLAMDIVSDTFRRLNKGFGDTAEGMWLYENCHRFGFIVRYRAEWTAITGYASEPWHFRYLGKNHATAVQALNIPYEIYAQAAMELPEFALQNANACLLYGVIADVLYGEGCLYEELCNASFSDEEAALQMMSEMTVLFLPPGITLEAALENEVSPHDFPAR